MTKTLSELRGYAPPTWQQYDRSADQWAEWKRQAAVLPESELRRHASVSTSNRHHCVDCFCCAALAVLQEIECGPNGKKATK